MRRWTFGVVLLLCFFAEFAALIVFAFVPLDVSQNIVSVNEAVQSVKRDWGRLEGHKNETTLDYVVVDDMERVLLRTKGGLSETLHEAVIHRDTILDITVNGRVVGKLLIYNDEGAYLCERKRTAVFIITAAIAAQCAVCAAYFIYLNRMIIKPFGKLKQFAERVAGGNLEVPLEMDRKNLFGSFTESFDIMRSELKEARIAQAKANEDKKELVAKLSHDIKTPVASIKAASEVGYATTEDERAKNHYMQIIRKADQINTLVTNLFTATLEELRQLSVTPGDITSGEISELIRNADYLQRAVDFALPGCLVCADKLRLQQVLDNIFGNSYKYADTDIEVTAKIQIRQLVIAIEDYGGGLNDSEIFHLKEKFRRGSNSKDIEGAGLGLYISDYFMNKMHGMLTIENGRHGLKAILTLPLSGTI